MSEASLTLVRFGGEVFIKSRRTRSTFLARLRGNVQDALAGDDPPAELELGWDRLYVRDSGGGAPPALARVFGISSFSPLDAVVPAALEAILEAGTRVFTDKVRGRTFAVRARRAGRHPFSSQDIQVQLGARLLDASAGVDLGRPEVAVEVEVREDRA